jgi:glycosyltransferase involved in cell wall biosynthesis
MCCGLPTIATFATAMVDYMTEDNSYPLKATPLKIKDHTKTWWSKGWLTGYELIPEGEIYEVDPNELAKRMKEVYDDYGKACQKGQQARQDIINKWSWELAVDKLHKIILKNAGLTPKKQKGVILEETRLIKDMEFK